jgi:hypothetical protein
MTEHYGFVYHPVTGACIAKVENGRIVGVDGRSYILDGDRILGEDGEELGYLSAFVGKAVGSGDIANKLFGRG